MAEEKRELSELIAIISALKSKANSKIRETIKKIIHLAYEYPFHNKQFTFDKDKDLEDSVNKLLIELTDAIESDIDDYILSSEEIAENTSDNDLILPYIHRDINGEDLTERLDKHMTRLKNSLEAYIAVGFANFMTESELYNAFLKNMSNPFNWQPIKDAYKDSMYEAKSIKEKGFSFGKYINRNIEKAIGLVLSGSLIGSYNYATQLRYKRNGAIGWTTKRGSTYDCPICDSEVGVTYPMTEIFTGWHPNCVCILVPVYEE